MYQVRGGRAQIKNSGTNQMGHHEKTKKDTLLPDGANRERIGSKKGQKDGKTIGRRKQPRAGEDER